MTESLQLTDQPAPWRRPRSLPVEAILAKLLIGHFALQHVVGDHQDRVSHRHRCFLRAMPASKAGVVRRKVGPLLWYPVDHSLAEELGLSGGETVSLFRWAETEGYITLTTAI